MKLKLLKTGRPVDGSVQGPYILENRKYPHRVKDHPIWKHEDRPWTEPTYPGKGQHQSIEIHYLYRTVLQLGIGNYANLGTFRGASTSAIAHGLKTLGGGKVYAVDIFGVIDGERTKNNGEWPISQLETVFEERGLSEYVEFCKGFTQDVVEQFIDTKFKYVFIDADHYYESCKQDFELWSPLIEDEGLVIFHDVDITSVDKVIKEISDEWELVEHVWKIKSFRRKK